MCVQGAAIGDVFVSTAVLHHDRRIPIPGFDKYGVGRLDTHSCPKLSAALGLKTGIVSSGAHKTKTCHALVVSRTCRRKHACAPARIHTCTYAASNGLRVVRPHVCVCAHLLHAGNSLDYTDRCMEIMTTECAAVKEMEAAAIAWVCHLFNTPLICVKVRHAGCVPSLMRLKVRRDTGKAGRGVVLRHLGAPLRSGYSDGLASVR